MLTHLAHFINQIITTTVRTVRSMYVIHWMTKKATQNYIIKTMVASETKKKIRKGKAKRRYRTTTTTTTMKNQNQTTRAIRPWANYHFTRIVMTLLALAMLFSVRYNILLARMIGLDIIPSNTNTSTSFLYHNVDDNNNKKSTNTISAPNNTIFKVNLSNGGTKRSMMIIQQTIREQQQQKNQHHPQQQQQQQQEAQGNTNTNTNSFTGVDRIYYINMDHRIHRRGLSEEWLSDPNQHIPYQRISGLKGANNNCVPHKNKGDSCVGVSGVILSNLNIITNYNTTGYTLVVEDDFAITDMERLLASVPLVPTNWDIIRFDCWDKPLPNMPRYGGKPWIFSVTIDKTIKNTCLLSNKEKQKHKQCYFCGGTHVALWKGGGPSLEKVRKVWSQIPYDDVDCRLSDPSLNSYCINIGIGEFRRPVGEITDIPKAWLPIRVPKQKIGLA